VHVALNHQKARLRADTIRSSTALYAIGRVRGVIVSGGRRPGARIAGVRAPGRRPTPVYRSNRRADVRDGRLANLLVVLICLAAILQRVLPLAGIGGL
jgi:hypothetical protein